jgi:hypothetical protein
VRGGQADDARDLGGRGREGHGERGRRLEVCRLVAAMGLEVDRIDRQAETGERRAEVVQEGGRHRPA